MNKERGYFAIIAVIFILIMGVMGVAISNMFASQAQLSVHQLNGLRAFYIAETGLEVATRALTTSIFLGTAARVTCNSLTGNSAVTNETMANGVFTVSTINSSPIFAVDNLSAAISASDTTINVTSTAGFAPFGRIMIDKETMDYENISGNSFVNVTRATNGISASHASGAGVGQYQCSINSAAGIPNLTTPTYERALQWNVQLQDGFTVGNLSGSNFVFSRWNRPTERSWNATLVSGGSNVANLNAVSMVSYADGWAVGNTVGTRYTFLRWNGSSWQLNTVSGACSNQHLNDVSMVSATQGWAVGVRNTTTCNGSNYRYNILRWNGSAWTELNPTTAPTVPSDNNSNQTLNAVHVIDTNGDGLGNIGFAVGQNGHILQYNGTNWIRDTSPTNRNLFSVHVVSANEAWAVGQGGIILRWTGGSWTSVSSPTTGQLNDIVMLDTDGDGFADIGGAVGSSGRIAGYANGNWTLFDTGSNDLFGIDIYDAQDAWVVGAAGSAYHWNGTSWTSVSTGVSQTLQSISLIGPRQKPTSNWRQAFG